MNENETLAYLGDAELDSRSSDIGSIVADAGYDVTPRVLINRWNCWSISVGLFRAMLQDSVTTNSIGINKWSGGQRIFKVGESGDGDSRMVAWVRADGARAIDTNGDPDFEWSDEFDAAWEKLLRL